MAYDIASDKKEGYVAVWWGIFLKGIYATYVSFDSEKLGVFGNFGVIIHIQKILTLFFFFFKGNKNFD